MNNEMQEQEVPLDAAFLITLVMIFLTIGGFVLILFSLTYIKDLETLADVPQQVWNLVCGSPSGSSITLPLLLTLSILSFMATGVLGVVRWWLIKRKA